MPDVNTIPTPLTAATLIGHAAQTAHLLNLMRANRLPHALLFTGPKGIGKATLANHLARFLLSGGNAQEAATLEIALNHPIARRMQAGSHGDFLSISPAFDEKNQEEGREISIEAARAIAPFMRMTPSESFMRVVIVDSADDLNRNAANAILKILEEPPPASLLILISHQPAQLLPTIRSRCQTVKFDRLSMEEGARILSQYSESSSTERNAYMALANGSAGQAIWLERHGALAIYELLLSLLARLPDIPPLNIIQATDKLFAKQSHANWRITAHLFSQLLAKAVQQAVMPNESQAVILPQETQVLSQLTIIGAKRLSELYQAFQQQFSIAERLHLEYKSSLSGMLQQLMHACRPSAAA